jgi:hypothetical protein
MKGMKAGIKVLRVVALLVFIWMAVEGIRAYYFAGADLARYMEVAKFLLGPWFAVFSVAAGGSHFKRWTETLKIKNEAKSNGLQGITG